MASKLETVQQALLEIVRVADVERIPLEACWHRVLAENMAADMDFPPFDRSPLDGYAVIASEVDTASREQPVVLREVESIAAGEMPHQTVATGTACRIMTGAPLPGGATGVVKLEDTARLGRRIHIFNGEGAARNICRRGEEIAYGEVAVAAGTVLNSGAMGTLALLGRGRPLVHKQPRVGIIVTGSELAMVDDALEPGKIHDSNSYMLGAQVREAGGEPVLYGVIRDDVRAICAIVDEARDCDMILTTGGVSVGDYDLARLVFARLGITALCERVNMKPGMPVLAGLFDDRLLVGLSGNPAAASIAFEQIIRPLLLKMGGRRDWWRQSARATMTKPFGKGSGIKRFVWAYSWMGEQGLLVEPLPLQGNGMLKSAIAANSLIALEAGSPPIGQGENIEVILLH
jgi:molybdopterin molybdotransferase